MPEENNASTTLLLPLRYSGDYIRVGGKNRVRHFSTLNKLNQGFFNEMHKQGQWPSLRNKDSSTTKRMSAWGGSEGRADHKKTRLRGNRGNEKYF